MYEPKIYRRAICHDSEKVANLEEELTCRFKIEIRTLMNFNPRLKNLKNVHFNGPPLTKVYNGLS